MQAIGSIDFRVVEFSLEKIINPRVTSPMLFGILEFSPARRVSPDGC
jgi:hypothetical protein